MYFIRSLYFGTHRELLSTYKMENFDAVYAQTFRIALACSGLAIYFESTIQIIYDDHAETISIIIDEDDHKTFYTYVTDQGAFGTRAIYQDNGFLF